MGDAHYLTAVRYVERNPVRARMVRKPWRYAWSSAAAHIGRGASTGVLGMEHWIDQTAGLDWEDFLVESDGEGVDAIRLATHRGRPLASDSFLSKLETKLNRRLRPLPVGRPRKESKTR
jgi:putative transposase